MSITFKNTDKQKAKITAVNSRYNDIIAAIEPYDTEDANSIRKLQSELAKLWRNFTDKDRKLNIAVVGRVKAGKSTFLNTVIFGGRHILPEAFTPKTATLTKIEYAEENSLEVEYYTNDEWHNDIEARVKTDNDSEEGRAAKELMDDVRKSGVDVEKILSKGSEQESFAAEDELMGRLNRYVGANGEVTPLVKCVTLKINKPELAGISIVDTPGLNDPVISRTQKTREFLSFCDVVFFLSPASQFLDKSDVDLLRVQMPQKGVARFLLISSRFDDALTDAVYDHDDLSETIDDVKKQLSGQAKKIFRAQIEQCKKTGNDGIADILNACEKPLFVSSLFHNMIGKDISDYNEVEDNAFDNLNVHDDLDKNMIATIGDISAVNKRLEEIIKEKDLTLARKAESFAPLVEKNLALRLSDIKTAAKHRLNKLETEDMASLEHERKDMAARLNDINARLEEYFGAMNIKMEHAKTDIMRDLRQSSREYGTLATKTGTEVQVKSFSVSDSHWYNPFSWGKSHREYYTYETHYTYVDANDALENIRNYEREACSAIEEGFRESTDVKSLKNNLLKLVVDNFNSADIGYDPSYFRLLTEKALNKIELPLMKINVDEYLSTLSGKFSGEVRSSSAQSELRSLLDSIISKLYDVIGEKFVTELTAYKLEMDKIKNGFAEQLLKEMNADFEKLKKDCKDKEQSIERIKEYVAVLEKIRSL